MTNIKETDLPAMIVRSFGVIRTQDKGIVPFKPFIWQNYYLESAKKHPHIIIDKSREIGSSTIAVLNYTAETVLNGGDFLIASYKKESAQFLYETARLFLDNLKKELMKVNFYIDYDINTKTELIIRNNGAHIKAMEMSPKVGRSFRFMRLLATEIAFWDNAYESWQALTGAGVANAHITVESTSNPDDVKGGLFEELLANPAFYKITQDYTGNPAHDIAWRTEKINEIGKTRFRREYMCDHTRSKSGNLVVPILDYYTALKIKPVHGVKHMGVDVARYGNDSSIICIINGNDVSFIKYKDKSTTELAQIIDNTIRIEKPTDCNLDAIGVGAGTYDILADQDFSNIGTAINGVIASEKAFDSNKYINKRAEMYFQLQKVFSLKALHIPEDEALKEEIFHTHYKYHGKQLQVENKEQIKKAIGHSPDELDALAMANYNIPAMEADVV